LIPKASVKVVVGNKTFSNIDEGLNVISGTLTKLQKELGELTRPFDDISGVIIRQIHGRFDSGAFGDPPFAPLGGMAMAQRSAANITGDRALNASGDLKRSVMRRRSPTKSAEGKQREVLVLRVGSIGVPYTRDMIEGSIWYVPVLRNPVTDSFTIDYDRLRGSQTSNATMYGERYENDLQYWDKDEHPVDVPGRDFLSLPDEDLFVIVDIVDEWFNKVFHRIADG